MLYKAYEWRELTDDGLLKRPRDFGSYYDDHNINETGPFKTEEEALSVLNEFIIKYEFNNFDVLVLVSIYYIKNG